MEANATDIPKRLGRYSVVRRLGRGGMAEVFLCRSAGAEGIEKLLVLKRVLPKHSQSPKFVSMFVNEAKVAMRLNHPNLVQVYAFEQAQEGFLLAMEFVDGFDLHMVMQSLKKKQRAMPVGLAAYCVMEVAKGLDYTHNRKDEHGEPLEIVHSDVSPQNVLISFEGNVKLADFGVSRAKLVSDEPGVIKGKCAYMSPEQARGLSLTRRSDVYALGVLLAELLTGCSVYQATGRLQLLEHVREGRVRLPRQSEPQVPFEVNEIVRQATALDPQERTADARTLVTRLRRFLHAQPEVYDATSLEHFLQSLMPSRTHDVDAVAPAASEEPTAAPATSVGRILPRSGEVRERREAVVVAGRFRFRRAAEQHEVRESRTRVLSRTTRVVESIAYKADAVLTWPGKESGLDLGKDGRFSILLGLGKSSINDSLKASQLALDIIDAVAGLQPDASLPHTVSLGVARGVVLTRRDEQGRLLHHRADDGVVELAEQLAKAAKVNQVLATGEVYRWARREYLFDERGHRTIRLKAALPGMEQPEVRAYKLFGVRPPGQELTAPAAHMPTLFGREAEVEVVRNALKEACALRQSRQVSVIGDLGVGKTSVVAAALRTFRPSLHVLNVEPGFVNAGTPLGVVTELVRQVCGAERDATDEVSRQALKRCASKLFEDEEERAFVLLWFSRLMFPTNTTHADDRPFGGTQMVARSVQLVIEKLAQKRPTAIWLDSVQWIDGASLSTFLLCARRTCRLPIIWIFSGRVQAHALSFVPSAATISLKELDEHASRQLIQHRFNERKVPDELFSAIAERGGGNPFFLNELVDASLDCQAVVVDEHRARIEAPLVLPSTLEDAVRARLRELPALELRALQWLAVAGVGLKLYEMDALAQVKLGPAFDALLARQIVRRRNSDGYVFVNATVRQEAYLVIDKDEREKMHLQVGALLRESGMPSRAARIAYHFDCAGKKHLAAQCYLDAGHAARTVYSYEDALQLYQRALSLSPSDTTLNFEAHKMCENVYRLTGRRLERRRELEALERCAERSENAAWRATACLRLARYLLDTRRPAGVESLVDRALRLAREGGEARLQVEALLMRANLCHAQGRSRDGLQACASALKRLKKDDCLFDLKGQVLTQQSVLLRHAGMREQALSSSARAAVLFADTPYKGFAAQALHQLGKVLAASGSYEDAITVLRSSIALDCDVGDLLNLGVKLSTVGQLYFELRDSTNALQYLQRALDVFAACNEYTGRCRALSSMAEFQLESRHDPERATTYLDEARRIALWNNDCYDLARERLVRAQLEMTLRRYKEADASAREAIEHAANAKLDEVEMMAVALQSAAQAELGFSELAVANLTRLRRRIEAGNRSPRSEKLFWVAGQVYRRLQQPADAEKMLHRAQSMLELKSSRIQTASVRTRFLSSSLPDINTAVSSLQ